MNYVDINNHTLVSTIRDAIGGAVRAEDPKLIAPLSLAYIGDTVYDMFVRTELVSNTDLPAHWLHVHAAKKVCAKAQAEAARKLEPLFTEEEEGIFRRGRNSHIGTVPKNASIADYRLATALEAVVGWLYLSGQDRRLCEIMHKALFDNTDNQNI